MFDTNKTKGIPLNRTPNTVGISAFNMQTIHQLLDSKGIIAFHIRHALSPERQSILTGEVLKDSHHSFIYYDIRPIRVVPQSMDSQAMLMQYSLDQMYEKILLNIGGYYLDNHNERVIVRPNDIILFNPTVDAGNQQLVEVDGDLITLPQYVNKVDYLIDSKLNRYEADSDFVLVDGKIKLHKPAKGVFSVVYTHRLIYNIESVPHYLRILQSNSSGAGSVERQAEYAPSLTMCRFVSTNNFGDEMYEWWKSEIVINYQQWFDSGKFN